MIRLFRIALIGAAMSALASTAVGKPSTKDKDKPASPYASMKFRMIGPAHPSGRISDFAVDPNRPYRYFIGTASGGLWFTDNNGITYRPLFDTQASYSIGVVRLDPRDSNTVWLGTGENNAQRSVAFGDGVYRSTDGGNTWKNVGLKASGHISDIDVHPDDSNTVFVASQGPLWNSGGDRGLYKTTDAGKTWTRILAIDDDTGVNEVLIHPKRPDLMLASSYQRRRHVWTQINGGPGSGIHRSADGGKTWTRLTKGLPKEQMGRIGLAFAPSRPERVYAIIEAITPAAD